MNEQELIERVMTLHWDMAACLCPVCDYGRARGWAPRDVYLPHKQEPRPEGLTPDYKAAADYLRGSALAIEGVSAEAIAKVQDYYIRRFEDMGRRMNNGGQSK